MEIFKIQFRVTIFLLGLVLFSTEVQAKYRVVCPEHLAGEQFKTQCEEFWLSLFPYLAGPLQVGENYPGEVISVQDQRAMILGDGELVGVTDFSPSGFRSATWIATKTSVSESFYAGPHAGRLYFRVNRNLLHSSGQLMNFRMLYKIRPGNLPYKTGSGIVFIRVFNDPLVDDIHFRLIEQTTKSTDDELAEALGALGFD